MTAPGYRIFPTSLCERSKDRGEVEMYGEPFIGVDFTDLIRGEGDWRNMQDVVRRTFRQCLETQKQQSEKIAYVTAQLMATKEELNRRPTWEDIERLVETKMMMKTSRGGVPSAVTGGIEDLRLEVANVKASLETKVNMRTLENILSKKVDRSDLAVRSLADSSAMTVQNDVKQLKEGFLDLQSRVSVVESDIHKVVDENDFHQQKRDLLIVRTQVDNIYRSMNDFPTKDHIKHLLDQKVNHSDIPTLIGGKADGERVHNVSVLLKAGEGVALMF